MDAYQQAVEFLTEHPDKIMEAWSFPSASPGGCLFYYVNRFGPWFWCDGKVCGCLTFVKSGRMEAETLQLTEAIRSDERIVGNEKDLTVDHLPIFAGWQRRIDQILGRTPPEMDKRLMLPKGDIEIPAIEMPVHVKA
jgi:hypothetical protein